MSKTASKTNLKRKAQLEEEDEENEDETMSDRTDSDSEAETLPEFNNTPFMIDIPDEKKKLLELKYQVSMYAQLSPKDSNIGAYSIVLENPNSKKSPNTISSKRFASQDNPKHLLMECELQALISALKFIYSLDEQKEYMCVDIQTSSVYVVNVVREWLALWAETQFEARPNKEMLKELWTIIQPYKDNIQVAWQPEMPQMLKDAVNQFFVD